MTSVRSLPQRAPRYGVTARLVHGHQHSLRNGHSRHDDSEVRNTSSTSLDIEREAVIPAGHRLDIGEARDIDILKVERFCIPDSIEHGVSPRILFAATNPTGRTNSGHHELD